MTYTVKITDYAVEQMQDTMAYISKVLQVPDTARKWLEKLKQEISELNTLPNRFPLVNEELWRASGIHKMQVGNFIVYYWVDDVNSTVWVTAVIYGRRDQLSALRSMPRQHITNEVTYMAMENAENDIEI